MEITGLSMICRHGDVCLVNTNYSTRFCWDFYNILRVEYDFVQDEEKRDFFIAYGLTWWLVLDKKEHVEYALAMLVYVSKDLEVFEEYLEEIDLLQDYCFIEKIEDNKVVLYPHVEEFVTMEHWDNQEEILRRFLKEYSHKEKVLLDIWKYVAKFPKLVNDFFHIVIFLTQSFINDKKYYEASLLLSRFDEEELITKNLNIMKYYKGKLFHIDYTKNVLKTLDFCDPLYTVMKIN